MLQNLYQEAGNNMRETKIKASTTTNGSSYPWAANGITILSESEKKFFLIGLKHRMQAAEDEARKLLKAGEKKEDNLKPPPVCLTYLMLEKGSTT